MKTFKLSILFFSIILMNACVSYKATTYDYPDPVDTKNKAIKEQVKKQ